MTVKELEDYYKTGYRFHKMTGMSHVSWMNWHKWGFIPIESQIKLQRLTDGLLMASLEDVHDEQ